MYVVLLSVTVASALGQDSSRSSTVTLSVGGAGGGHGGPTKYTQLALRLGIAYHWKAPDLILRGGSRHVL